MSTASNVTSTGVQTMDETPVIIGMMIFTSLSMALWVYYAHQESKRR